MIKRIGMFFLGAAVCALCLDLSERFVRPGGYGFVATVEAIVGRPLTPVSVAGVARRSVRRCAAGVYHC